LVALQRDARQAADGVRDVSVGEARDDLRREHVQDVLGALLLVQGRYLAIGPGGGHGQALRELGSQPALDGDVGTGINLDVLFVGPEADVRYPHLVLPGGKIERREASFAVGDQLEPARLDVDRRSRQHVFADVEYATAQAARLPARWRRCR